MANVIVLSIILVLVILAAGYIVKAKKRGQACIGCPNASGCGSSCHCDHRTDKQRGI